MLILCDCWKLAQIHNPSIELKNFFRQIFLKKRFYILLKISLLHSCHENLILNLQVNIGIAESLVRSDPCSTNCSIHLRFNIWKLSRSPGPQLETSDWSRVITWPGYWPLIGPQPGAPTWDWVRQSFGSDLSQKFCVRGRVCWEGRLVSEESLHVCYKIIKC